MKQRMESQTAIGQAYEQYAIRYLTRHGLQLYTHNYRIQGGEIDLICKDQDTFVFIEVKYRKQQHLDTILEQLDQRQLTRIRHVARVYLHQHAILEDTVSCRFDLIVLYHEPLRIAWFQNAF